MYSNKAFICALISMAILFFVTVPIMKIYREELRSVVKLITLSACATTVFAIVGLILAVIGRKEPLTAKKMLGFGWNGALVSLGLFSWVIAGVRFIFN